MPMRRRKRQHPQIDGPLAGFYLRRMTKLLETALEAVRSLPPAEQDDIARAMLNLAGHEAELEDIDLAHVSAVLEGLAQAKNGQLADEKEIEAAFRRFGR